MREQQLDRKTAAKEFAEQIRKLAETGSIDTLSMIVHGGCSDNLYRLAESVDIKELTITAMYGVSR